MESVESILAVQTKRCQCKPTVRPARVALLTLRPLLYCLSHLLIKIS